MATNKFLIFDEQGANMQTDAEYQSATQRIGGVLPGLAEPEMHNKLYRQVSIMAAAIGKVLAEAGYDANDSNMNALAANIKALFVAKPLDAYPVGAIYISTSAVSPSQLFGGTWQQIQGRFLLASSSTYAAGSTGGEASHTLTTNEIPAHNHGASSGSAGAHAHILSTDGNHTHTMTAALAHSHSRGTMNITGYFGADDRMMYQTAGAFSVGAGADTGSSGTGGGNICNFDASKTWTGFTSSAGEHSHTINATGNHTHTINSNGAHTHTVTTNNTGGGAAHNNMPPYLSVYVWKRTA